MYLFSRKIFLLTLVLYFGVFSSVFASTTPNPFTDPNTYDNSGAAGATAGTPADKLEDNSLNKSQGDNINDINNNTSLGDNLNDVYKSQSQNADYKSTTVTNQSVDAPQSCDTNLDTFGDFLGFGTCLINRFLLPILILLALVIFFFGVSQYVLNGENTEERAKGRQFMLWGILALFVLVSIWGIIKLLSITFGFGVSSIIPQFK